MGFKKKRKKYIHILKIVCRNNDATFIMIFILGMKTYFSNFLTWLKNPKSFFRPPFCPKSIEKISKLQHFSGHFLLLSMSKLFPKTVCLQITNYINKKIIENVLAGDLNKCDSCNMFWNCFWVNVNFCSTYSLLFIYSCIVCFFLPTITYQAVATDWHRCISNYKKRV